MTQEEFDKQENYGDTDSTLSMRLNIEEPDFRTKEPRYISPSHIRKCGKIGKFYEFEHRIPISNNPGDMATVGNCIHQIFAIIEDNPSVNGTILNNIIRSYGLSAVLTDTDSILSAWKKLYDKLVLLHGKPVKTYHERPFRMDYDGQTIVGSIDLVWQTQEGNILVDFKNNPMAAKYILDPDNEHFAGWYAGQLDAYQDALEAAGENILQRYIYYPVRGLLVEI